MAVVVFAALVGLPAATHFAGFEEVFPPQASGCQLTDELRRELEEVIRRHGGELKTFAHPTTTLEELFLRIVAESKAHPGRRYLPAREAADRDVQPPTDGREVAQASTSIQEHR